MSNLHVNMSLCHYSMARHRIAHEGDGLQMWRVAANVLNKLSRTIDNGYSYTLRVGQGANNSSP
jgi:hypothetical protein